VATVVSVDTDAGTSLVEFPGGNQQILRGTGVAQDNKALCAMG